MHPPARPAAAPSPATPVIEVSRLRREYRVQRLQPGLLGALRGLVRRTVQTRVAVADLDLRIGPGEFVGLLGRNGAGKTTTVKMMSGLLRPTGGTVRVLGHDPARRGFAFLRRISVVLGQKSMLWWDVSTLDSLGLHAAMYDLDESDLRSATAQLAELLDLQDLLDVPVGKLSLGERMKCELLVALVHRPEVLFLDEPTIGLDVVSKATIRQFLAAVNEQHGTTIVLTSHDMGDVEALCRRVLLIDSGHLRFDGALTDLVQRTRPHKQVTLSYAGSAEPPTEQQLPPGVRLVSAGAAATGSRIVLEVDRDATPALLAAAPGWGELADLEVRDADLDEVMRTVLLRRDPS